MKKHLFLTILLCTSMVQAQDRESKRPAYRLEIAADEHHQYAADLPESPYLITTNTLQLFCNEKILIECEIQDNQIENMKVVEQNYHPDRTISVEFFQDATDRQNIQSTLLVKNPFDKELRYEALMLTPTSQEWRETSIIPISPHLQNYEMWPHAIIGLVLGEWTLE